VNATGDYDIADIGLKTGPAASISEFSPQTDLERRIALGADTPAPGENQANNAPKPPLSFKAVQAKFSATNQALMFASKLKAKMALRAAQTEPGK